MSNKQVIAIFLAGIFMMMAAFWAGLRVINGSAAEGVKTAAQAGKPAPQPKAPESAQAPPENSQPAPASSGDDTKYVVRVAAFGTLEQAQKLVGELKDARYLSAHVRMPDSQNSLYTVFIGAFARREDAQQVANELASQGKKGLMIYQDKGN